MKPTPEAAQRHAARTLIATPVAIPPICVRIPDAALLLGISPNFVAKLIATGDLPHFKQGACTLIRVEALTAYAAAKETATTQEREQLRALARQQMAPFPIGRRRKAG